ncbi:alpha-amylase family glycosyl hydrolase [Micromonospora chalcea]|uniref:alpha-amylase family glycosyl hydrolase n=1 Tax=Micromonospora sp. TSRI0369 TaxID=1703936 RepID=UPI0018E96FED
MSDYQRIAPRYGTDEDLADLVESARRHGIRILLDPVAGHTSGVHPWFRQALDNPGDDRYIWADRPAPGFVASPGPRPGYFLRNFLDCQLASTDVLPRCLVG